MNRQLELLVLAYDALLQAQGEETKAVAAAFDARMDDALDRYPNLSRETLGRMIVLAHRNWLTAQRKPPSMPPKA
jgi:hypothetical protein